METRALIPGICLFEGCEELKITWGPIAGTAGFAVTGSTEGEELSRLDSFAFDAIPEELDPLRSVIAGVLVFGDRRLERITTNDEVPSKFINAIESIIGLRPDPEQEPASSFASDAEEGSPIRATTLEIRFGEDLAIATPGRDITRLTLVPSERYSGVLWGVKEAVVASNAWLHLQDRPQAFVAAAAGVLYADEFMGKTISLPSASPNDQIVISRLCELVGLEVIFGSK